MSSPADAAPGREAPLPEGEERPPSGVHAAAVVRWAIVGLVAVAAAGAWVYHATAGGGLVERQRFQCPMHPTVVQYRPGECPICGMDLVAADGAPAAAGGAHGHVEGPAAAPGTPRYTCPMHPAFVTADPKARCPECGMKLSPVEPAGDGAPAAAREGVPGVAPVDLTAERIQLMGLRTAVAAREPLSPTLRTVGFVSASEGGLASVSARYTGWVETLVARETGQPVEKGQVLATIYSPELVNAQQVYLNAIRWSEAQGSAQVPAQAGGSGSGSGSALERDARQRLELAGISPEDIALLGKAGQAQRAVNLRSPVRGYVARKAVVRGAYVQPGVELFQIADLSTVWVLADVQEGEIGRVKVGQKASLEVAAHPGQHFEGKVQFLYPALDTGSRTLQARIVLANPGLALRPGMYGEVTLETEVADAVTVPREALVDTGDHQYVFVARAAGRFEPRRVKVGQEDDGKVVVLEGLAAGERVVTSANFLLDSESRLRAAAAPGAAGR